MGFLTIADALLSFILCMFSISTVNSALGASIFTISGASPIISSNAATLAAVATLPVVIPDFSFEFL